MGSNRLLVTQGFELVHQDIRIVDYKSITTVDHKALV